MPYIVWASMFFIIILFLPSPAREVLPSWDKQIQSICYQVNSIIEKISQHEPAWLNKVGDEDMMV